MYDIDLLYCPRSSGHFFQRLHARKRNDFVIIVVVLVFALNKNILPVCNYQCGIVA